MNAVLKINEELNGIELYFSSKPSAEIRNTMKASKFRYSANKNCWYAKQSETAFKVAQTLTNNDNTLHIAPVAEKTTAKKPSKKNTTLSLWDACQWSELNISQSTKDQDCKEIAKEIRTHIRKRFPQCKFSVRVPYYGRISFDIKSSPFEKGSTYLDAIKGYCISLLDAYKHCYSESDPYTDYAGVYNFTGWVEISWQYEQTESTEAIKQDMIEFDTKLVEQQKVEEARKEAEFQVYLEEQKKRDEEYKKQRELEKQQKEGIYNNVTVNELEETKQYFIVGSEFAHLNKNNTIDQYKEEIEKGKYSLETVKVTKEIHFNNLESLTNFSNMLLHDFDFLAGTGGSYTDDNRINTMTDYYNMTDEEKRTVQWLLKGVAVYFNNDLQFVVDAQGHNYARYVGLIENATIEETVLTDQLIEDEELNELKHLAEQIETISADVITELNIISTWENESWKEYKELFKSKLKQYNIKLTKDIIQQLEIDSLKIAMYKILTEVEGIQQQFEDASIKQGEKVTLFYISDWGMITTSRITFDHVENKPYAQYDNAVKVTFTPERKRNLHYKYFHSELLVFKGWHNLPDEVLYNVEVNNGIRTSRSKYHSCDHRQYDEIIAHFEQQGIKPLVNTCKPIF